MTQTVLVLGPTGRFGRNAALAFEKAGWDVRRFDRKTGTLQDAARGVDLIVNAWNPPYQKWNAQVLAMQPAVYRAALDNDATVVIPGNVYVFGENTPAPWSDKSEYRATNLLGQIRIKMEQGYRDAGVRTIVLRAGDYLDTEPSGNWFDRIMAPSLRKGALTFPGKPGIPRAWAFLPDLARATVLVAEQRDSLDRFADICFEGYTLSAQQMAANIAEARGHDVRIKEMAWWPLRLVWPFMPEMKHIFEMRYIWNTPHWLDGTKFNVLVPEFEHTPMVEAFRQATDFVPLPKGATLGLTTAAA
ncbi:epimerase [Planktotalea arctica]|uniref:epimerase n=1 Tax=Planktotalea arctica TaxID=1481893 RepID=UPI000A172F6D|nr:epimerase [Planktotalea arctica]